MKPTKKDTYLNSFQKLKDGSIVKVVEYENCKNITIEFDYGYQVKTTMISLKSRNFKHPNQKTVYGIGYIGVGEHKTSDNLILYDKWSGMLRRCYDSKFLIKHPSYEGCSIIEEWHNFQVFAEWFYENWKPYMKGWHLDKDILVKGNKIYSPETCCFVPQEINGLLITRKLDRGMYPIGVSYNKRDETYTTEIPKNKKGKRNFKTVDEAFKLYKELKEEHIKEKADYWKDKIDLRVYKAMYDYRIEITD